MEELKSKIYEKAYALGASMIKTAKVESWEQGLSKIDPFGRKIYGRGVKMLLYLLFPCSCLW